MVSEFGRKDENSYQFHCHSQFQKDQLTNHYIRDIQFQISDEQLQRLELTSDIRDIDGLISDIIAQSGDSTFRNIVLTEFTYHLSNLAFYLQTKNVSLCQLWLHLTPKYF
jgi:hypothetical protein